MLVTAPGVEHPPGSEQFTQEVMDPVADSGPLRGVLTALERARTDQLIVTTCDMPLLTCRQFDELLEALSFDATAIAAMCRRADGADEIVEPFPMAMRRREALKLVGDRFSLGERSPAALARLEKSHVTVLEPRWDSRVWINLNHREDLKRFLASIPI
jgi:molybdopterin-guanine dinucleotide biosynthesis protein A